MLKVLNDLLHSLDRGNVSVVTLLDLSAAFDHTILLQRLRRVFDIHKYTALHGFSSYLSNRTQTQTINNGSSALAPIFYEVPH